MNSNAPKLHLLALCEQTKFTCLQRPDPLGNHILHIMAEFDDPFLVELAFRLGARNLDASNRNGETPLHVAVSRCNIKTARRLVELGADRDCKTPRGRTLWHTAINRTDRDPELLDMLDELGVAGLHESFSNGETILDYAVRKQCAVAIRFFLERNVPFSYYIKKPERDGRWIDNAAACEDVGIIRAFRAKGVAFDTPDEKGRTILHFAAARASSVEMFSELGVDCDARDDKGRTPMLYGVSKSHNRSRPDLLLPMIHRLHALGSNAYFIPDNAGRTVSDFLPSQHAEIVRQLALNRSLLDTLLFVLDTVRIAPLKH